MPRGPSISEKVEALCYKAWQLKRTSIKNGKVTIKEVFEEHLPKYLVRVKKEDQPGLSWFNKRVTNQWEAQAQKNGHGPMAADQIVEEWDEKWWKSPRSIYVLTTLYYEAHQAIEWSQSQRNDDWEDSIVQEFTGFTDRVCKWALKLSEFFDLNVSHQCCLLILVANQFAYEERKKMEYPEDEIGVLVDDEFAKITFPLGRDELKAWQRHKMGYAVEDIGIGRWLWQFDAEQMWHAITSIASFGQVLVSAAPNLETDVPNIFTIIE